MRVHTSFFMLNLVSQTQTFDEKISCVQKWDDTYIQTFLKKKSAFSITDLHWDIRIIAPLPLYASFDCGERGGSVVECRTPEREVRGSKPTTAVLCPWARHFTPRKYWLITQEAVAPSRHDWKIVDWDVKPQHKQIFWL